MRGVVFIVSDALRADAFERLLSLDLLPNLKRLGERGTIFRNAYSTTNMTDPSMTTILSGLHPLAHGIVYDADLSPGTVSRGLSTPSIQQLLRPEFRTTAVDLQIPGTWHRRGFDWYVDDVVRTSPSLLIRKQLRTLSESWGVRYPNRSMLPGFLSKKLSQARVPQGMGTLSNKTFLKKTTDIALEQVASSIRAGMKFFAFVHYWATHAPYLATPSQMALIKSIEEKLGLSQRLAETSVDVALLNAQIPSYRLYLSLWFKIMNHRTLRDVVASYYASLINVDHEVGRLMELIDGEGATDEVIFVFAGDHGEGLSEHGVYFSHHALYDTTIKVPILLAGVSLGKAMAGAPVSHTDIVPTLLSALGQSRPGLKFDGYDLLSLEGDSDSLADRPMVAVETLLEKKVSVTQRGRKLIRALSSEAALCKLCQKVHGGSMSELYDLATAPSETRNETGSNPDQMKRLEPLAQRAMFVLRTREAMLRANPVAQLKGRPR